MRLTEVEKLKQQLFNQVMTEWITCCMQCIVYSSLFHYEPDCKTCAAYKAAKSCFSITVNKKEEKQNES